MMCITFDGIFLSAAVSLTARRAEKLENGEKKSGFAQACANGQLSALQAGAWRAAPRPPGGERATRQARSGSSGGAALASKAAGAAKEASADEGPR